MMKQEFENLLGHSVEAEQYEKIEYVYTWNDFFADKAAIVDFYKKYSMSGIERMYAMTRTMNENVEQLKAQVAERDGRIATLEHRLDKAQRTIDRIHSVLMD